MASARKTPEEMIAAQRAARDRKKRRGRKGSLGSGGLSIMEAIREDKKQEAAERRAAHQERQLNKAATTFFNYWMNTARATGACEIVRSIGSPGFEAGLVKLREYLEVATQFQLLERGNRYLLCRAHNVVVTASK